MSLSALLQRARELAHHPVAGGLGRRAGRDGPPRRTRRPAATASAARRRTPAGRTTRRTAGAARRAAPASPRGSRATRRLGDDDGRQIGLGKVPVVVRFFLAAHRDGDARGRVPQPRFLHDTAAALAGRSICRSISYSSAFCRNRNEFRFLTSAFVPSVVGARADGPRRSRRSGGCPPPCCRR